MTSLAARVAEVHRPGLRPATLVSAAVIVAILLLGALSIIGLGFSWQSIVASFDNYPQFFARATPLAWPGFEYNRDAGVLVWVGWEPVWEFFGTIAMTLGIVITGTFLSTLISIPVASWAARNTTPHPSLIVVARGIGVVARAVPDVAFASIFVFLFALGPLPGILALMLHSVGMISKMFADAIEQIDEGPRLAIRSTGASKMQEFWSGVVPQVLPAWIAVSLHRADINLRATVVLGYVGVSGLGYELSTALQQLNYRRAIPIALTIILLCVLFEIISSMVRARLLNVKSTAKGRGDTAGSTAEKPAADEDHRAVLAAVVHRPWNRERIASVAPVWLAIAVIGGAFVASQANWRDLLTFWGNLPILLGKDHIWPPSFGIHQADEILGAILVTFQVAFAATLISAVLSCVFGVLAARNVAPSRRVRNFFRGCLLLLRGIPELILAIMFILLTGLGAQAGTLALGIAGVGLLGKLVADSLEEVPSGPLLAVGAAGGSRPQVFFASTVPLAMPSFVAHLLYMLEQNVRAATILGIVGGGGIGYYLYDSLRISKYDQMFAFLALIILLVLVIEGASVLIRRAIR